MNLPEKFRDKMRNLLIDEYEIYEAEMEQKPYAGLRANLLKISREHLKQINPFPKEDIPWTSNGCYYDNCCQPAKHPHYYAGLYYIQEPSAMLPAEVLPIKEGDHVLDLCAAPGGKSTALAAKLGGTGLLVSNDISNSRAKALLKNIELAGIRNALVTSESPDKLLTYFKEYFDAILVDAPCSGEGMFRKDHEIKKSYEERGFSYYVPIQKNILCTAASMLKPGGYLVYSTCTFSPEENEEVIAYLLEQVSGLAIEDTGYSDFFEPGHPDWTNGSKNIENLKKCLRLWPHKIKGEGHFTALLRKDNVPFQENKKQGMRRKKAVVIPKEAEEFLKNIRFQFDMNRLFRVDDRFYYLPQNMPDIKGLRVLRSGWYLGDWKKNRFEPSQALAAGIKKEEFSTVLDLSSEDERVIRYLKGETVELYEAINGYCLVCTDGYPLGFGKGMGYVLKNKYQPGWRML